MKRYVHSNNSDIEKLAYFDATGNKNYLPMWALAWTDEQIAEAKEVAKESLAKSNKTDDEIEDFIDSENDRIEDLIEEVVPQLRKEGYTKSEIDQIVNYLYQGHTLDDAMQRVDDLIM